MSRRISAEIFEGISKEFLKVLMGNSTRNSHRISNNRVIVNEGYWELKIKRVKFCIRMHCDHIKQKKRLGEGVVK